MESICIITDNSVQFPHPNYPGRNLVKTASLKSYFGQKQNLEQWKTQNLPSVVDEELCPKLVAPTIDEFRQLFIELGNSYRQILGIFLSSKLSDCYQNAEKAAKLLNGHDIQIVDSQTTSASLGLMVQTAAQSIVEGATLVEAEHQVRSLIPQAYAVLCIPDLSYLHYNGFIDRTQALIGEMLGLLPIFTLEEGSLTPIEKLRSHRQITEFFLEFLDEFEDLQHVALLQPVKTPAPDVNLLKEYSQKTFTSTTFSTHTINLPLATLFGPTCTALLVLENGG